MPVHLMPGALPDTGPPGPVTAPVSTGPPGLKGPLFAAFLQQVGNTVPQPLSQTINSLKTLTAKFSPSKVSPEKGRPEKNKLALLPSVSAASPKAQIAAKPITKIENAKTKNAMDTLTVSSSPKEERASRKPDGELPLPETKIPVPAGPPAPLPSAFAVTAAPILAAPAPILAAPAPILAAPILHSQVSPIPTSVLTVPGAAPALSPRLPIAAMESVPLAGPQAAALPISVSVVVAPHFQAVRSGVSLSPPVDAPALADKIAVTAAAHVAAIKTLPSAHSQVVAVRMPSTPPRASISSIALETQEHPAVIAFQAAQQPLPVSPILARTKPGAEKTLLTTLPQILLKTGAAPADTQAITITGSQTTPAEHRQDAALSSKPNLTPVMVGLLIKPKAEVTEKTILSAKAVEGAAMAPLVASSLPAAPAVVKVEGASLPLTPAERAQVVHQAAAGIAAAQEPIKSGVPQQMTIQLHPKDWGRLQVSVTVAPTAGRVETPGQKTVIAHIVAESPQVKAALEGQAPRLRQALRDAGMTLDRLTVSVASAVHHAAPTNTAGSLSQTSQMSSRGQTDGSPQTWSSPASFAGNSQNGRQGQPAETPAAYSVPQPDSISEPLPLLRAREISIPRGRLDTRA